MQITNGAKCTKVIGCSRMAKKRSTVMVKRRPTVIVKRGPTVMVMRRPTVMVIKKLSKIYSATI